MDASEHEVKKGGVGGSPPTTNPWQGVAERVAAIIRVSGIEVFRHAVRQVVRERLNIQNERSRREKARCEAVKKDGVLYRDGDIPEQPEGEWFFHLETIRGSIKLPPEIALPPKQPTRPSSPKCLREGIPRKGWSDTDKDEVETFHKAIATFKEQEQEYWPQRAKAMLPIFEHVKSRGFPNDEEGDFPYEFDICAWLPAELHYNNDPPHESLLPVPRRALTDGEKMTILAAVYDAHWRGAEKIAPWGVSEDGKGPDLWPSDAKENERRAALGYFMLFREAENLGSNDLPIVRSWLDEWKLPSLPPQLAASAPAIFEPPPPPPPPPPADTTLVFASDGDGYFIRGFGAEGHFKSSAGLRRLEKLLHNAGRPVLMASLMAEGEPRRSVSSLDEVIETPEDGEAGFHEGGIQEDLLDEEALEEIRKELLRLDGDIEKTERDHDAAETHRLQAEKEQILDHLRRDSRFGGGSRAMTSGTDRLRSAIANSLSAAYKKLRNAAPSLEELADHLKLATRAEGSIYYIYVPHPIPPWSFDKPSS